MIRDVPKVFYELDTLNFTSSFQIYSLYIRFVIEVKLNKFPIAKLVDYSSLASTSSRA